MQFDSVGGKVQLPGGNHLETDRPPFNPELEQAMIELSSSDTPEGRIKTYKALLASELILPIWNATDEAGQVTGPIKPIWIGVPQANVLPAFTAWNAVKRWKLVTQAPSFVVLRGQGVFAAACEVGSSWVWINPNGPIDMRINATDMVILAIGAVPGPKPVPDTSLMEVERDTFAVFGPPTDPPAEALVADLSRALEGCSHVQRAFLFQATVGAGSRLTLGIVFDRNPNESMVGDVMRSIGPAVRELMQGGPFLDMVVLQGETLSSVESAVKPFFKRVRLAPRWWFSRRSREE